MTSHAAVTKGVSPIARTQWVLHLFALGGIVALILAMFQYEVVNAVQAWWIYATFSHCVLIGPISAWLIWEKRRELALMTPTIAPKALFAVPVLLVLWFTGKVGTINELRQFIVVGLIDVAILAMLGPQIFRAILFPVLYLFFLVPFGLYLIPPMQQFATRFTDVGLTLLGVVHYTEGTIIELPNASFEIAEACAGLRFLIATMALGVLFVHLAYRKFWKIAAFLVACVAVPLVANGLRCIGTIALGYYTNSASAVEADHVIYGWGFNIAILVVMYLGGMWFRDSPTEALNPPAPVARAMSHSSVLATAAASLVAIGSGPALAYWQDHRAVTNTATLASPKIQGEWTFVPFSGSWTPLYASPDQQLKTALGSDGAGAAPVDVAVLYYARIREEHSLIATTNHLWDADQWHPLESHTVTACLGTLPIRFTEAVLTSRLERRIVWSTYWMDGQFTTSGVRIKLQQLKSVVFGHEAAALVALSTPMDRSPEEARARLVSALAALGDLPEDLNAADGIQSETERRSSASSPCAASVAGSTP
jgi:exosortase A